MTTCCKYGSISFFLFIQKPCSLAFYTTINFDSYIPPTFSYRECFYYLLLLVIQYLVGVLEGHQSGQQYLNICLHQDQAEFPIQTGGGLGLRLIITSGQMRSQSRQMLPSYYPPTPVENFRTCMPITCIIST